MSNHKKEEDILLQKIEDYRRKMINASTLFPLNSYEVISISQKLDKLLNDFETLKNK